METTQTPVNEIGEFSLIERMETVLETPVVEGLHQGIGDDAAVYFIGNERVHVITTDALIEGVHFSRSFMPMAYLGFKSIAVNVSDVVAMNASPLYATIALGLPHNVSVEMVEAFYRGVRQACEEYGLTVVGGDTTAARQITIAVTVVGEAAEEDILYRRGARPGDLLCVTGDLGAAYAGLKVLLDQQTRIQDEGEGYEPDLDPFRYVIQRQLMPRAKLATIRDWAARRVRPTALIDVSDGLASETHHLCRQSRCGALIYGAAIPIDLETRAVAHQFVEDVDTYALFGGEDYELLFALPEQEVDRLDPETFAVVGRFTDLEEGVRLQTPEGAVIPLEAGGFEHFGKG